MALSFLRVYFDTPSDPHAEALISRPAHKLQVKKSPVMLATVHQVRTNMQLEVQTFSIMHLTLNFRQAKTRCQGLKAGKEPQRRRP